MPLRAVLRALAIGALVCASGGCGSSSVQSAASPTPVPTPAPAPTLTGGSRSTTTTVLASSSVLSTIWTTNGALGPVIMWRGGPDWWSVAANGGPTEQSSSSGDGIETSGFRFGALVLTLTFDSNNYVAAFQGRSIPLPRCTNVLFIDTVDAPSGPTFAGTLILDPGKANLDPPFQELIPVFRASPQIMTFLQCDLPVTSPYLQALFCDSSSR